MGSIRWTVAVLTTVLLAEGAALAATVQVPGIKDNTLYQPATGGTTNSNGAGEHLFAGRTDDGYIRRAVIAFNLTNAIPSGSTITAVTLTLYMSRTRDTADNVTIYRALANWGEGASNASQEEGRGTQALPGDATWYHRFYPTSLWATAGGDFRPTASATVSVIMRDAVENSLGLPSGPNEIPLVIQDRKFHADGSLVYPATWDEHFFGDTIIVNGKVWPYLIVNQGKHRFRIVNGSTSRTYTLALSSGAIFHQIGTDGGMLPAPVPLSEVTLMPGERADVVMDFANYASGAQILLTNSAPAPFPGPAGAGLIPNVMKFIVTNVAGHTAALPATLRPLERLYETNAFKQREFVLKKTSDPCTGAKWLINDLGWDDITEFPVLGTTEVWSFINRSGVAHPMHLHLVLMQILDRQPFVFTNNMIVTTGPRVPAPANEAGWKDTVRAGPNEITRVIARFDGFPGRYPYHCHIIEHEDHEMMRQFQVVLPPFITGLRKLGSDIGRVAAQAGDRARIGRSGRNGRDGTGYFPSLGPQGQRSGAGVGTALTME